MNFRKLSSPHCQPPLCFCHYTAQAIRENIRALFLSSLLLQKALKVYALLCTLNESFILNLRCLSLSPLFCRNFFFPSRTLVMIPFPFHTIVRFSDDGILWFQSAVNVPHWDLYSKLELKLLLLSFISTGVFSTVLL